jgi:Ca2+-binding EF-hand superfamily protein
LDSIPNHKISLNEFKTAIPNFAKWGVKIVDAEATFKEIDTNHSGGITFTEFVKWASKVDLDLDDDDNNPKWE